jgi:outer membrane protein OmpA-like peptidoglycan-associated protein
VKATAISRISRSVALTALPICVLVQVARAQVPQVAAEASVAARAAETSTLQAQTPALGQGEQTADSAGSDDYVYRYKPQDNLLEAGIFLGPLFISDRNSFRGPTVVNPGRAPTVMPVSTYKQPSVELGLRGAYLPLAFLGGELEGMVAIAESDAGAGATVLAARLHVLAQLPYWSIVPFAVAGVGFWSVRNDVSGNDSDPAFHFGGGAKVNVASNVAVRVDIRDTLTSQRGENDYPHNIEALAGANLVFGRDADGPKDSDRDNVVDERDQCPLEAGTLPNGCPVRDSDSDGIPDPQDQCAMEVGLAPTGCPIRDADQDGVVDADDQCISEKGGEPTGCPDGDLDGFLDRADKCPAVPGVAPDGCLADADGDGFFGADDRCLDQPETKNGFEDKDGCPDELPAAVKSFIGVIAGIEFDSNRDVIRPSSDVALAKAASVLIEYPSLRVEIIGHTDSRGSREHNVELSLRRAEAVKGSLISRGIAANRIQSRGEGPDVPLTTNETAAGRQKNRRIEFRIIE